MKTWCRRVRYWRNFCPYSLNKKEKSRGKRAIYTVTCMDQGVTIMCDVYCNTRCCHIVDCVISAFLTNISFLYAHLVWCQKISLGIWTIVIKFYSKSLARGKGVVVTDCEISCDHLKKKGTMVETKAIFSIPTIGFSNDPIVYPSQIFIYSLFSKRF